MSKERQLSVISPTSPAELIMGKRHSHQRPRLPHLPQQPIQRLFCQEGTNCDCRGCSDSG